MRRGRHDRTLGAAYVGNFLRFGTHLVVGQMSHTGLSSGMRLLCAGVPSVILARFDALAALEAIDKYT